MRYRLLHCGIDICGNLSFTLCLTLSIWSLGTLTFNKYIYINYTAETVDNTSKYFII